ncbi:hypothetical protein [Methylobacterium brachythecii]|uniref:Uncharacterized protein n=1 Tax=Methylobacterium brachythecii TaxID=1176177 RepID=A0A7W6AMT0_9HYPH|nr:hypothetical protein [Methylobacterium brachythecii]MBB3904689.1 hypothetical protein [Methylobacterium brachythecii]GLS46799.1 hypothetical protein GCM10007884_47960 [Methylobacterium brachythecii]
MAEERLRTVASLRGTPALTLSAWRGRSGRRYVVGVHDMGEPDLAEMRDAVVIAVRRDGAGIAQPVCVATSGESPRERLKRGWLAHVARRGATEMHVHRLAQTEDERRAVLQDLDIPASALN